MPKKNDHERAVLPRVRPVAQVLFLALFLYTFFRVTYPLKGELTRNVFFNLDPLVTLSMVLSRSPLKAALLLSLVTVVVTVLLGRVFCGWMCPLGTVFDLSAKAFPRGKRPARFGDGRWKNIKYYLLAMLLAGSVFGFTALLFFDPLVLLMRVMALNVNPALVYAANGALHAFQPLAMRMGWFQVSMLSFEQPVLRLGLASLGLFAAIITLIAVERRFWCRNLCPLGATLSLMSRFSPWGRRVSDACISCAKCARECPMNAIHEEYTETSGRECIQCLRCETVCPVDAISFGGGAPEQHREYNPSRRRTIVAAGGGVVAGLAFGTAHTTKAVADKRLRPPGALEEPDFVDACLRCGECMKACPTHGLQPALGQAGIEGLFTPVLVPRIGACEERCNNCGQVCPTGAIRALPLEEKQFAVIGNAVIEQNRCIAWEQGKVCLICDEVCPYDAIQSRMVTDEKGTLQRPFVIEAKCVGCGQCESGCPVNGPAAIHVTPINEVRKNDGSYITDEMKRLREVDDESGIIYEEQEGAVDIGAPTDAGSQEKKPWETGNEGGGDLPPGFVE